MVVLHFSSIKNNLLSGVCVVVPQYVFWQEKIGNEVALVNVNGIGIDNIDCQIPYNTSFNIDDLPSPFNNPDIVVFQECYRKEYLGIGRQLQRKNIPYVIIPHGELSNEAQEKKYLKKKIANILLFNRFINGAAAIQCLSSRELDNTRFGKNKIIATNGVIIPETEKTSFNLEGKKITYIGRLDAYHKGLDILINAASLIKEKLQEEKVIINIFGPDFNGRYAHIKELINKSNLEELVILHHEVTGDKKEKILLESDIFIQTSRFEGMPLGILEAMSYGIPCLVTRGTTLGEAIEQHNAGWVAETNEKSVSEQMLNAIAGNNNDVMGKNARVFIENEFSWKAITEHTIDAYNKVLANNN